MLVKKLNLSSLLTGFLKSGIWTGLVFGALVLVDTVIIDLKLDVYEEFAILIISRFFVLFILYFLFWKKTLWYNELKKRVGDYV